jgi:kinesin family member 21
MEQREKISRKLNRCLKKLDKLLSEQNDEFKTKIDELKEQIEIMKSNLDYIQDQISECQVNIIQLDESKDSNNLLTSKNLITSIGSLDEAKYLIGQFYLMALNKGVIAAQKEYLNKELECELAQYENDHLVQQQLLQQMMSYEQSNEPDYEIDEIILAPTMDDYSSSDDDCEHENNQALNKLLSGTQILRTNNNNTNQEDAQNEQKNQHKARATVANGLADLLYGRIDDNGDDTLNNISSIETSTNTTESLSVGSNRILSQSYTKLAASSLNVPVIDVDESNTRARTQTRSLTRQNSKDSILSSSPNGSPHARGRLPSQNRDDVFNRLTSETKQSPLPDIGCIRSYNGNTTRFKSSPLTCCHVAEGHAKAVLSVDSFENKLFTSSKDRTSKIWDLNTGQEIVALIGHPNNVTKIKYCAKLNLIFTVSQSIVKVWDERDYRCIKTLSSSGTVTDGEIGIYRSQRTLQNEMPSGEQLINDIHVNKSGTRLYTAAGNSVKIWDMSQFMPIGRLSGGHNASIMTLAVDDNDFDSSLVITGSKDHYIKLFDVTTSCYGQISPKRSLTPPHYDGIQALRKISNLLFSGSRDMCIKKWDLNDYQCKQSINNAHKDWICALDYIQDMNLLVSGCRAGYLKFWSPDTCQKLAEFRAHTLPINSIKVDEQFALTASE